jgi:CHAT domain-containing protein
LKRLDRSHRLSDYRVLHIATHGFIAAETGRYADTLAEPSLLLTPPARASQEEDGLLTASEVAQLDLDADWVVLSACNTAASGGRDQPEALSGLARAFFYSGARSLLVSHWYVDSLAAVKITTAAFAELRRNPSMRQAEALRLSMLAAMRDADRPKTWLSAAHPTVWAPFSVVEEVASER